jgi:hypothetical protein
MSVNPVGPEVKHFGPGEPRGALVETWGAVRVAAGQGWSLEVERLSTSQSSPTLAMVTVTWFL